MFKIGDRVRLKSSHGYWAGSMEVTDIQADDGVIVIHPIRGIGGFLPTELELISKEKQMVNYHVLNESIVVNFNGKTEVVSKSDGRYKDILACIKEGRLEDIPVVVDIAHGFKDSGIELKEGILYENNNPIPVELNNRILKFKDEGIPFDSLLKFWDNLKANPSFNSRKMLFAFLENNGHPLTQDGCFIAYRGVSENFKDQRTGEWDNKPGNVCEMPREQVDENPNNTCSSGLHVACFDYAKDFGRKLVEVKVNPRDVVCVPTDYNGTKMRVCRFEVVRECDKPRNETLYEHKTEPSDNENDDDGCEESEENTEDGVCPNCGATDEYGSYCSECGESLD